VNLLDQPFDRPANLSEPPSTIRAALLSKLREAKTTACLNEQRDVTRLLCIDMEQVMERVFKECERAGSVAGPEAWEADPRTCTLGWLNALWSIAVRHGREADNALGEEMAGRCWEAVERGNGEEVERMGMGKAGKAGKTKEAEAEERQGLMRTSADPIKPVDEMSAMRSMFDATVEHVETGGGYCTDLCAVCEMYGKLKALLMKVF